MPRKMKSKVPGYLYPWQVMERLNIDRNMLTAYRRNKRLKPYIPPGRKHAMYKIENVESLAVEITLFKLEIGDLDLSTIEFRVATPDDAEGIVNVLESMGWRTTSPELRREWYRVNSSLDHVVTQNGVIVGYLNMVPYKPDALEDMMSGRKRAWNMRGYDMLPYVPGERYDVFIGAAVRQDLPDHTWYGRRLISEMVQVLRRWAEQGIIIRSMHATANEKDGEKLCRDLGFVLQLHKEGDKFNRYMLNLETSAHKFAREYRKTWRK